MAAIASTWAWFARQSLRLGWVGFERALEGRQRLPEQGLGLVVALLLDEQGGMVIESDGDVGVVVAEQALLDREGASVERVGAGGVAGAVGDRGKVVERDRDLVAPDGDEVALATLGSGEFFGEIGILAETRRTATVRAVNDVELLLLDWTTFQSALEESDPTSRDFAEIVKERTARAA